jgi:tetratricopeptide (TPR) repeat protein
MYRLWIWWGHQEEGASWMERVIIHGVPNTPLYAEALGVAASCYYYMKDGETALSYCRRHLEERLALRDEVGIARAECNLAGALGLLGRHTEARPLFEKSLSELIRLNVHIYVPAANLNLADNLEALGEHERARVLYWESVKGYANEGYPVNGALAYIGLGRQAKRLGDLRTARDMFESALALRRIASQPDIAEIQTELAEILEMMDEPDEVRAVLRETENKAPQIVR